MRRITHKISDSDNYDTYDNIIRGLDNSVVQNAINKLGRLEDKIENGTLIELPCLIGTPVYVLCRGGSYLNMGKFRVSDLPEWGKRVFASPEDALAVAPEAELCETLKAKLL